MRLAEARAALRRNLSGALTDWSDELLDGALARAVDDLDRVLPQEKLSDFTLTFQATDEVWASGTIGSTVTLANKRIRPKSDVVKNTPHTITYVRDTDYTMDYVTGRITTIVGGGITSSADHHISYHVMEVYVDISGLTDLIRVARMEYPAGGIPSNFQAFYTWNDFLVITSRGRETQQRMAEKEHAWVYYHAKHTMPGVRADGSWSPQLDEVVIKGAEGYSLLTKALELRFNTQTNRARSLAALGELAAIVAQIDAALLNTQNQASSVSSDLSDIDAKLDDMVAALSGVAGYLALAHANIYAAQDRATYVLTDRLLTSNLIGAPLEDANASLDKVDSYLTDEVVAPLDNAHSFVSEATAKLQKAGDDLLKAISYLGGSLDRLPGVVSVGDTARLGLYVGAGRLNHADFYIRALPDVILNAFNADITKPISPLTDNITAAGNQLIAAVSKTDQVNIGELVSEMHRRYADSWSTLGRLEYDAWLTWLGRVDRRLAQGSAILAISTEQRINADGYLAVANVILGEITAELGRVTGYQSDAAQYKGIADSHVAQGQALVGIANAGLGTARAELDKANIHVSIAGLRLDEIRLINSQVNDQIQMAVQYVSMAQAKIAEGEALRTPITAILERASMKIEIARIYQQESDRRLQQLGLKQQEADRYLALASSESELADKFEETGNRAREVFMAILMDRAQVQADTALAPTRQEAPS